MKIFKTGVLALFGAVTFSTCSKNSDNTNPDATTPLIKTMAQTTRNGRVLFNYTYDDQKRLTSTSAGDVINPITYNLGGFQIVNTYIADTKKVIDFNIVDGRIKTAIYNEYVNQVNQYKPTTGTFTYDSKGRLINTTQVITLDPQPPYPSRTVTWTFTWDDNDNMIESTYTDASNPNYVDKTTYSGFSAENKNTLSAKNFGFDYFGTTSSMPYYPSGDGSSVFILPFIYPGKILPTTWKEDGITLTFSYHKNTQGYIDRIEETDSNDANDYEYTDIAYQ